MMARRVRALSPCCALLLLLGGCAATVDPDAGPAEPGRAELDALVEQFPDQRSTVLAEEIAVAMRETGDVRWVPWLVDLFRVGRSSGLDRRAAEALAELTGVEASGRRVADLVAYGNWMYDRDVEPGPGYTEWKIGLYERLDPGYRRLLRQVRDQVVLSRLQFGGVVRGGIPELDRPARLAIPEATHMRPDEIVYGTEIGGTEIAYPHRILGHHELVNDVIDGRPVAMSLCTLCRTAVLFDRRVDGRELSFETSGLLLNSNKVMVDRETETLWNQITGEAIAGPLERASLTMLPSVTIRWSDWVEAHPHSLTLALPPPVLFAEPDRPPIAYEYEPDAPQAGYYAAEELWFPTFGVPDVFPPKSEVITVALDGAYLAIGLGALSEQGPVVLEVGPRPILAVPTVGGARVYDGRGLQGAVGGPPPGGMSAAGPDSALLADGTRLPRLVSGQSFWFAWYGQHPDTTWWPLAP
jgi:hypothetical protein